MKRKLLVLSLALLLVALPLAACAQPAPAPAPVSVADFYRDNRVTLALGSSAGGGTDYTSRLIASYWATYTDGAMVVKNIIGGTGIVKMNAVWNAEPDGLTIGMASNGGRAVAQVLSKAPDVAWELGKLQWLGSIIVDQYALAMGIDSPVKSIDDLKQAKGLLFGGYGLADSFDRGSAIAINALGLDAKIIPGFSSGSEIALAAAKGELDGAPLDVSYLWDVGPQGKELLADPLVIIDFNRSVVFPDVPALPELVEIPEEIEAYMNIYTAWTGRYIAYTGPDVPADKIEFIRDTFAKIYADEGFLRQMSLRYPAIDPPLTGEETAEVMRIAEGVSIEDVEGFEVLINSYY